LGSVRNLELKTVFRVVKRKHRTSGAISAKKMICPEWRLKLWGGGGGRRCVGGHPNPVQKNTAHTNPIPNRERKKGLKSLSYLVNVWGG